MRCARSKQEGQSIRTGYLGRDPSDGYGFVFVDAHAPGVYAAVLDVALSVHRDPAHGAMIQVRGESSVRR